MNIHISVYADENEAKLTGLCFDTSVGTADIRQHTRIMELIDTITAELVEGLQDIIDNPETEEPDLPIDGPIDIPDMPSLDPTNPIPTPTPVKPPIYDM